MGVCMWGMPVVPLRHACDAMWGMPVMPWGMLVMPLRHLVRCVQHYDTARSSCFEYYFELLSVARGCAMVGPCCNALAHRSCGVRACVVQHVWYCGFCGIAHEFTHTANFKSTRGGLGNASCLRKTSHRDAHLPEAEGGVGGEDSSLRESRLKDPPHVETARVRLQEAHDRRDVLEVG